MAESYDRPTTITNETDTFKEILRTEHLHRRTAQVGQIVSFDPQCQTVSVQIGIMMDLNGSIEPIAPIQDVPVVFPVSGGAGVTFPINAGDQCAIVFADRAIGDWLAQGGVVDPKDTRIKHLSDAICIPGLSSCANPIENFYEDGVQLSNGGLANIQVCDTGFSFNTPAGEMLTVELEMWNIVNGLLGGALTAQIAKLALMQCTTTAP